MYVAYLEPFSLLQCRFIQQNPLSSRTRSKERHKKKKQAKMYVRPSIYTFSDHEGRRIDIRAKMKGKEKEHGPDDTLNYSAFLTICYLGS